METLDYSDMRSVTVKDTMKLVIQHGSPAEDGTVLIRTQFTGLTERVPEGAVIRLRKYIGKCLLDVYYAGKYTEPDRLYNGRKNPKAGVIWTCYTPCGNHGSAWLRMETPCYRTRFQYDPGHHFMRTLDDRVN
jgi:hypothetical protein